MGKYVKFLLLMLFMGGINSSCSENSVTGEDPTAILDSNTTENATENTTENTTDDTKGSTTTKVIFEDNFDQTTGLPDPSKWVLCPKMAGVPWANYLSGSNDQAYVKNGLLVVTGEKVNGVYKSGGIQTKGKVEFTYGKVEVRARFKSVQGGWPAIWMMPVTNSWPDDGEIDIMEEVSKQTICYQTVHSYYLNKLGKTDPIRQTTEFFNVDQFNTYAVDWTPEKLEFSINGKVTFSYPNLHLTDEATMKQWPFKRPFYIILNYALGGSGTWPGVITDSELPGNMEVDWVKVTQTT